jgi:hypothetical protein
MREISSPLDGFLSPFGRRRGGLAPFSPAVLFANNEPGVWYDPSDLTTLFQDTAGTTPVTTPGQTVALMLDKSKGLTLGPELVTNGGFDTDTDWTKGTGVTISGGVASVTSLAAFSDFVRNDTSTYTTGTFYEVSVDITAYTSGSIGFLWPATTSFFSGVRTHKFVVAATDSRIRLRTGDTFTGTIDNISVKELPGFHAVQATAAARPTYGIAPAGGRRNLLLRTEEFDNAYWSKLNATVSTSAVVDPAGGTSARLLVPVVPVIGSATWVFSPTIVTSVVTSISVFAKYSGKTWMSQSNSNGNVTYASFNLLTGEVGFVANGYTATMELVGDGWYRCTVTTPTNFNQRAIFAVSDTDGGIAATPNGSDGILLWGAQLEVGSTASAYQRVSTAFDVTEAGVESLGYLSFDGVDDWMVTPTITPGINKVQVFAGVRVIGTALGRVSELSPSIATNSGSWTFSANSTDGDYLASSRGTASNNVAQQAVSNKTTAPFSDVVAMTHDIVGDLTVLRRNGAVSGTATGDKGAGNFLAYPIYIGARDGTSQFFKGDIHSLITRFGANLEVAQIESTEAYVAGKTAGVTL